MRTCLIYVTVGNAADADRIAHSLVAERLAAAANILPSVRSFYWWDGALQTNTELVVILKTRSDLADSAVERIKALHSYLCPGIVVVPIEGGNPAYLDWIAAETRPEAPTPDE